MFINGNGAVARMDAREAGGNPGIPHFASAFALRATAELNPP
jgi:hypothetical protein